MPTETVTPIYSHPFRADNKVNQAMNRGHLNRLGHPITGYFTTDGHTLRLHRLCCKGATS